MHADVLSSSTIGYPSPTLSPEYGGLLPFDLQTISCGGVSRDDILAPHTLLFIVPRGAGHTIQFAGHTIRSYNMVACVHVPQNGFDANNDAVIYRNHWKLDVVLCYVMELVISEVPVLKCGKS